MNGIKLIELEWNNLNGLCFTILGIEWGRFESQMFGIHSGWNSFLHIYVFFILIEIKKPWYNK
jgi:hypothetical protein